MLESDYFIVRKCNNKKKVRNRVAAIFWDPDSIGRIVIVYYLMRFLIRARIFLLFESTTLKRATVWDWCK